VEQHPRKKGNSKLVRKPKLLRPYRLLRIELGRMGRLYDACLYSFSTTSTQLDSELEAQSISPGTKIIVPNTDRVLAWSRLELLERMKHTYPEMLRASLLVRAVSHMENYLVDLLNEVAIRSLAPFKLQDKIVSFSQAQLLSFDTAETLRSHLIQIECRALSGKGFREFEKFYKSRFNISFSQGPVSVDVIDGIYARRHLLVHAGGVVDHLFQKKYMTGAHPGQTLEISEDYFLFALRSLEALAEYCAVRIEALFPKNDEPVPPPIAHFTEEFRVQLSAMAQKINLRAVLLTCWFQGVFRTRELLEAHFSDDASFNIDEEPHRLTKILVGKKRVGERTMQWLVCGDKAIVGPYIAYLEYLSRRGMLEEFEKHTVSRKIAVLNHQEMAVDSATTANAAAQGALGDKAKHLPKVEP
jgi:hypothetical protein